MFIARPWPNCGAQGYTGRAIAKELGIPSSSVFKLIAYAFLTARHKRENALPAVANPIPGTKTDL